MKRFTVVVIGLALFITPILSAAQTTDLQQQVQILLEQVRVLQARLAALQAQKELSGFQNQVSGGVCVNLSYNLYADLTDATTNGDVSKLQKFLAQQPSIYPSGQVTGYFGPATELAVQKWQASKGLVSSGSPETTGFGYVGPKTRAAMRCGGGSTIDFTLPPVPTPPVADSASSYPSCTITASKTNVAVGESYTISWTTRNIDDPVMYEQVKAGGTVEINKKGSKKFTTPYVGTDTYQIGAGGLDAPYMPLCSVSVTATAKNETPSVSLSVERSSIYSGEEVELTWNVKNANLCVLNEGPTQETVPLKGSKTVKPYSTTTYRLWCANNPGTGKDGPSTEDTQKVYVTYPQEQFSSSIISLDPVQLRRAPGYQFILTGGAPDSIDEITIVIVDSSYDGNNDWESVGQLVKDGSGYRAVSNEASISSGTWGASFGGLSEGNYHIFIYDSASGELLGKGVLISSWKG